MGDETKPGDGTATQPKLPPPLEIPGPRADESLIEQTEEYWTSRSDEERKAYISQIFILYDAVVDEFLDQANLAVDRYHEFLKNHLRWRRIILALTGVLALLNVFLAANAFNELNMNQLMRALVPLFAAFWASFIAVIAGYESLHNSLEKAAANRDVREVFLNAHREYEWKWQVYVRPFLETPTACVNAARVYKDIVVKDREIRGRAKELIEKTQESQEEAAVVN